MKRSNVIELMVLAVTCTGLSIPSSVAGELRSRPLKLPGLQLLNPYQVPVGEIAQPKTEGTIVPNQSMSVPQRSEQTNPSPSPASYAPGSDSTRFAPGSTVGSFNQAGALSIGKVLIKPSATVSYAYLSNLQALSSGYQPDRALVVAPTIEAFIPLTRNGIRFEYSMQYRNYQRYALSRNFDHSLNADSQFDISPILSIAIRDHFAMSSVNAQEFMPGRELIFSDSQFRRNDLGLLANWTLTENDSLAFTASWNKVLFDEPTDGSSTPFYDYSQYGFVGSYKHDVSERLGVYASGGYRQNSTDDPRDLANSRGFELMGGIDGMVTPLISAQLGIGVNLDRYRGAAKPSATGFVLRGSLSKEISERSQVSLSFSRSSNLSNFQENAYFTTTGVGVSYSRELRPNIQLNLSSSYQHNGYPLLLQAAAGIPVDLVGRDARRDSFVDAGFGALYRYNDWLAMDIRFDFTRRYSDLSQFRFQSYRGIVNFLIGSKGSATGRSAF